MAGKRFRSGAWEYKIQRSKVLPRPVYFTFDTEAEGDAYVAKLEALLDKGVVPTELLTGQNKTTVGTMVRQYMATENVATSEIVYLNLVIKDLGSTLLTAVTYDWVERQVEALKAREMAPMSIVRRIGALARAIDWALRKNYCDELVTNPVRLLPKGYSQYKGREIVDEERNRRLEPDEEARILERLTGDRRLMFVIALETAMRLSEIYSLKPDQVDIAKRTIFLRKGDTKTGHPREVPMSSVMMRELVGFNGFGLAKSTANTSMLSKFFLRVFQAAGCEDLHFHDLRHEATCRLFIRTALSDTQISRITGHRDPRMLRRYASLRGSDLAGALW